MVLKPAVLLVGVALFAAWLTSMPADWAGWRPATCMPDDCFCEAVRLGTVRQPANTWSNLFFCAVGLAILGAAAFDRRAPEPASGPVRSAPVLSMVYGAAAFLVGAGSFFYHASLTFIGQWVDVFAMYLLAFFILAHNLRALWGWSLGRFVGFYLAANALGGIALAFIPEARRYVFAAGIGVALASEIAVRRRGRRAATSDSRHLWAGIAALVLAFSIWILDITDVWCVPDSLLQGHALWHILTAASAALMYLYYRSEHGAAAVT